MRTIRFLTFFAITATIVIFAQPTSGAAADKLTKLEKRALRKAAEEARILEETKKKAAAELKAAEEAKKQAVVDAKKIEEARKKIAADARTIEEAKKQTAADAKKAADARKDTSTGVKKAEDASKTEPAKKEDEPKKTESEPVKPDSVPKPEPQTLAKLVDRHIDAKLATEKLTPSPICTDEEFIRRAFLDITGVIPSADDAKTFLDDKSPHKRARLIDRLLDDPNYGRKQADSWHAKLFPRDSNNRFVLRDPFINWLKSEFNKNTSWDSFVTKLVTATGSVDDNPAVTYFLANRSIDKLTDTTTQHFLGVRLSCAQCHNHPFTPTKQSEYWGMAAFYSKVVADKPGNGNKGADNNKIGVREGTTISKAKDFFPESAKKVSAKFLGGEEPKLSSSEPARPVLAKWMTSKSNPYFAKAMVNRTWATLFGNGIVDPVDDMIAKNTPSHPELLNELARYFTETGYDVKSLYRGICNSQAYQRSARPAGTNKEDSELFSHMNIKAMSPEQLFDSLTAVTGATANEERGKGKAAGAPKGPQASARDRFVTFFLAGAEESRSNEYEAGIPQALKLINSRSTGTANTAKQFASSGSKPVDVIEKIYLTALSRRPTEAETRKLTDYVAAAATANEAYSDILWAVLNSSEFTLIR